MTVDASDLIIEGVMGEHLEDCADNILILAHADKGEEGETTEEVLARVEQDKRLEAIGDKLRNLAQELKDLGF